MSFTGKVAIVTGASRGIGKGIAIAFAREGAAVALVGRNMATLEATATACKAENDAARTLPIVADAADAAAIEAAVAQTVTAYGRIDAAVANAGHAEDALVVRAKPDHLGTMLDTNLKSAFFLVTAVARPMMRQRAGAIVLMSSIVGISGNAGQAAYAAAKAGLLGLAKSVAKELGSRNIRVNAVAPGLIETAMTEHMPDEARSRLLAGTALGRAGTVDDVAGVVTFLCSDAARYVTGQTIIVDGGFLM
jgi:3-oxoacyl-[acyl-carrier protein] reductase